MTDAGPPGAPTPGPPARIPRESGSLPPRGADALSSEVCPACLGARHVGLTCGGLTTNQIVSWMLKRRPWPTPIDRRT